MEQIDWSTEWWRSPAWIGGVFVLTLVGFVLIGWLLIKRTGWGRQFWRLSSMYFIPYQRSWLALRPILTVALLLLLTVISVRLDVLLSFQGNELFTSLQEGDQDAFWRLIGIFGILATVNVLLVLFTFYIAQAQIIHWRLWLNQRMVGDWMSGTAYHRGRFVEAPVDNPDQRIQADVTSYVSTSQGLALGAVSSSITLVSFTIILWNLSGPLEIAGVTIPKAMVFLAYIYVIIATVFAFRIGRPLIRLNFLNERLTASYRYSLVRVRDNSENVAFYRGEQVENAGLMGRFAAVIANTWAIVFRSLKFQGFNLVVSQIAVVFPIIIQAPRFFARQITLGDVTQTANAFGQVQGALSFFRLAYDDFAGYRAVMNRLTGLLDANDEARGAADPGDRAAGHRARHPGPRYHAAGRPPVAHRPGPRAGRRGLIAGPRPLRQRQDHVAAQHGRAVAACPGKHRPGRGRPHPVRLAAAVPAPGHLAHRAGLPAPAESLTDDEAGDTLRAVYLGHLVDRLDEESDWAKTLSPGEQQRLAFGRILLLRPSLVFLDETTSALDEGMEYAMYELVRQRLPGCTIVSVGHRSSLGALHTDELTLQGDGRWEARTLVG